MRVLNDKSSIQMGIKHLIHDKMLMFRNVLCSHL